MVQRLIDEIQVQNNLTITLAKTKINEDKLRNLLGAVSYMATKVTEAFGVEKYKKNQRHGYNKRRISAVEVHVQVCGGRFQGRGCVRGRICGHSNGPFYNGVDCQYFKRSFNPRKLEQMGAEGNSYINQKRT